MPAAWNNKHYDASVTRTCLAGTPYGDAGGADRPAPQNDPEMHRLLELEASLSPLPNWARGVTQQIARLSPFGWAMPYCVEAICQNIGAGDPEAARPSAFCHIGQHRLQLMTDYAICLEGWLKGLSPETTAARTSETSLGWRDWEFIAGRIHDALGKPGPNKATLVRRLLAKLRFWLRASRIPQLENARAGEYVAVNHEPELADLDRQIRQTVPHADRWLELIESAWPGATRIFHYIERMMAAIGELDSAPDTWPDELVDVDLKPFAAAHEAYRTADPGRVLYQTVLKVLNDYLGEKPNRPADPAANIDDKWADRLTRRLGQPTPVGTYLAALTRKRITLLATRTRAAVAGSR
jgi:hypothetical protein